MECHEEDLGEDHYEGEECAGCHTNERLYPEEAVKYTQEEARGGARGAARPRIAPGWKITHWPQPARSKEEGRGAAKSAARRRPG